MVWTHGGPDRLLRVIQRFASVVGSPLKLHFVVPGPLEFRPHVPRAVDRDSFAWVLCHEGVEDVLIACSGRKAAECREHPVQQGDKAVRAHAIQVVEGTRRNPVQICRASKARRLDVRRSVRCGHGKECVRVAIQGPCGHREERTDIVQEEHIMVEHEDTMNRLQLCDLGHQQFCHEHWSCVMEIHDVITFGELVAQRLHRARGKHSEGDARQVDEPLH
mmetsp:Transcript_32255/g.80912  ORF Transcript_32255/g.80912 Transcript_32255/m.80912 type:complete len:219 (+) Transcript_32255:194-850(+)